jgi:hypothetical protein
MKKILIFCILLAGLATIFHACRKDDNPTPPDLRFPLPLITKDMSGDDMISGKDPENFLGKFVVAMYYGSTVKAKKIDVVVIRNDNRANVKTIKTDVTSFPASLEVTGTQLATIFDSTIELGDRFEIGVDVTTEKGEKFEAFPVSGKPYGADTAALPGSSFSIVYVADCTFNTADFNGFYTVLTNTWDYKAGDSVEVRPGVGNKILITAWPHPEFGSYIRFPMTVDVDPVTYEATVPLQGVGDYAGGPSHIIDSGTGTVSPCGDKITLSVTMSVGTFFGDMPLVLGK